MTKDYYNPERVLTFYNNVTQEEQSVFLYDGEKTLTDFIRREERTSHFEFNRKDYKQLKNESFEAYTQRVLSQLIELLEKNNAKQMTQQGTRQADILIYKYEENRYMIICPHYNHPESDIILTCTKQQKRTKQYIEIFEQTEHAIIHIMDGFVNGYYNEKNFKKIF